MKFNPGKWSEELLEGVDPEAFTMENIFGHYGKETTAEVMRAAQEWVSQFTVVIASTGMVRESTQCPDIVPGSGVLVRLNGHMHGLLTAGHVLRRGGNTPDCAAITVLVPPRDRKQGGYVMAIDLPSRPCTVVGFDNKTEDGPDIAIIRLASGEWTTLERWGMVAYNLDKKRWSDEDKAELGKMKPWLFSIINGVRCEASQIVHSHTDGEAGSLAIMASNTRINILGDRCGYDYLELPSETTPYSYPTQWESELPGTAAEEIDELHNEGVTRRVWGGTSGAGVWNLAIGTTRNGLPDGKVLAELAGICFYANPDRGCIIAHGTKSIARIAANHIEQEALRYHSKE